MGLRALMLPLMLGAAAAMPLATPGTANAYGFGGGGFHGRFGGFRGGYGGWHGGFRGWRGGWHRGWGWGGWGVPAFAAFAPVVVPPPIYVAPPPPPIYVAPPPPPPMPYPAPAIYAVPAPVVHPRVHHRRAVHVSAPAHHACHCTCSCIRN